MMKQKPLSIIKIGGNIIDDAVGLHKFLSSFASVNHTKILIHGGGKVATSMGGRLGIASKYIDGRRITDDETLDLVTMVYGGLVNKKIVALLQSLHCDAIGITGADANLIPAIKRPVKDVDFGWAGDIDDSHIPVDKWKIFLGNGIIPVVAPLTHDNQGHLLNTNADTIAATLAIALGKEYETQLIYCFEKKGILEDVNDESTVMNELRYSDHTILRKNNRLTAGILPKLENAFQAKRNGVKNVIVGDASDLEDLISGKAGTRIET